MMKSYEIYIMFPLRYQCSTVEPLDDPRHEALAVRGLMLRIQQQMALVLVDRPTDPRKSGWFYYVDMLFLDVFSKKNHPFSGVDHCRANFQHSFLMVFELSAEISIFGA